MKESESFVLTLLKDSNGENSQKRVNVKKIVSLDEIINRSYDTISIELNDNYDLE